MTPISTATTGMVHEDLERASNFLLERFEHVEGPLSMRELVQEAENAGHTRFAIQLALWTLTGRGKLKLTTDWRVERGTEEEQAAQP